MYSRIYFRGVDFLMTNPPEDEARAYADNVCSHDIDSIRFAMREPHKTAIADHLAGQSVGYQRALEEVEKIMNERWWPFSDSRLIELGHVINGLKSKGGA